MLKCWIMWEHLEGYIGKKFRCSPDFWRNLLIIYFWNFEQVHRFCYKVTLVLYIGIRKFTKARYRTTYWATLIQSMLPHTNSLRYILVLFSHLQVGLLSVVLSDKNSCVFFITAMIPAQPSTTQDQWEDQEPDGQTWFRGMHYSC